MPAHEFVIITKLCARADAVTIVKRLARNIWERKGLIRDIEYLGNLKFPTKKLAHDQFHWRGLHWILKADIPVVALSDLQDEWKRDIDLISQFCDSLKTEETFYPVGICC
ncbi:hypothetical protein BV898_19966 [Hypsibius exemplaris]|uniref:Uncharacterized protein n=1 Tax=Hypsibius exemplaris TaxID=2072580 RepID=A0A9X6RPF2_HYPEX|nr:hypothetical protein BV898_19966 [Hypsibius exemplaris]